MPTKIYKMTFDTGRIEYCQAKSQLDLLQQYEKWDYLDLHEVKSIEEISMEEAQKIHVNLPPEDDDAADEIVSLASLD